MDVFPFFIPNCLFEKKYTKIINNNFDRIMILNKRRVRSIIIDTGFCRNLKIQKFKNLQAITINGTNNYLNFSDCLISNDFVQHIEFYGKNRLSATEISLKNNLISYLSFYHYSQTLNIKEIFYKSRATIRGIWLEADCINLRELNTFKLSNAVFIADSLSNLGFKSFENLKLSSLEMDAIRFGETNDDLFLALNSVDSIGYLRIGNDNFKFLVETFLKLNVKGIDFITLTVPKIDSSDVKFVFELLLNYKERFTLQVLRFDEAEFKELTNNPEIIITKFDHYSELMYNNKF
jgi:hypothetical protein